MENNRQNEESSTSAASAPEAVTNGDHQRESTAPIPSASGCGRQPGSSGGGGGESFVKQRCRHEVGRLEEELRRAQRVNMEYKRICTVLRLTVDEQKRKLNEQQKAVKVRTASCERCADALRELWPSPPPLSPPVIDDGSSSSNAAAATSALAATTSDGRHLRESTAPIPCASSCGQPGSSGGGADGGGGESDGTNSPTQNDSWTTALDVSQLVEERAQQIRQICSQVDDGTLMLGNIRRVMREELERVGGARGIGADYVHKSVHLAIMKALLHKNMGLERKLREMDSVVSCMLKELDGDRQRLNDDADDVQVVWSSYDGSQAKQRRRMDAQQQPAEHGRNASPLSAASSLNARRHPPPPPLFLSRPQNPLNPLALLSTAKWTNMMQQIRDKPKLRHIVPPWASPPPATPSMPFPPMPALPPSTSSSSSRTTNFDNPLLVQLRNRIPLGPILENDAGRGEVGGTADEVAKGVNKRRVQMNYNEDDTSSNSRNTTFELELEDE